jgi:hypothetical protein
MNGFGTERTRRLDARLVADGWAEGNWGENRVVGILNTAGISPAVRTNAGMLDCRQQYQSGRYVLDFAWPKLKIAIEADGKVHRNDPNYEHDRIRDAWLRGQGWLVFRVDTTLAGGLEAEVKRVVAVIRALAPS